MSSVVAPLKAIVKNGRLMGLLDRVAQADTHAIDSNASKSAPRNDNRPGHWQAGDGNRHEHLRRRRYYERQRPAVSRVGSTHPPMNRRPASISDRL